MQDDTMDKQANEGTIIKKRVDAMMAFQLME